MSYILRLFIGITASFLLPITAFAEDGKVSNLGKVFQGAPKYKAANGNWIKLRGRVLYDVSALTETPVGGIARNIDDDEFRAARIGLQGRVGKFKYVGELDFAGGKTSFKDFNVTYKGLADIQVGQMKTTNSMEEQGSSLNTSFIERAMVTDAFGLDRRLGVVITKTGVNYGLAAGVFGNSIDAKRNNLPGNTVLSARGTFAPILQKDKLLHLGASIRYTKDEIGAPKRSTRWGPHLATEKTKPIMGGDAVYYNFEVAGVIGKFHAQAEYMAESGDLGSAKGGFVQAGYFLTGETRAYKAGVGKFDRTKPLRPLSEGGFGGLEVVARIDTLDARNAFDEQVTAWTAGLTWYPESHLRVRLNYTDANGDRFVGDGWQLRLQVDW